MPAAMAAGLRLCTCNNMHTRMRMQVKAQSLALDEQRRHLDATKKAFDRERLGIAEERRYGKHRVPCLLAL